MFILGGWNKISCFHDFFALDLDTLTWTRADNSICPPPMLSQYSVAQGSDGLIYYFGGFDAQAQKLSNVLYAFNPKYFPA